MFYNNTVTEGGEKMKEPVRPRGTESARVIRVIETKSLRGRGTKDDTSRLVTQYWDFQGNLLAEYDPEAETIVTLEDA